jgi:predicted GNAT family acetyltransferase
VVIAFSAFHLISGNIVLTHTETDPQFDGRGFASLLAKGALEDGRARGEKVVPLCPFIKAYIKRHPEYADLVVVDY